ncbi:microtubule-associated protein 2-like isoform X6 [Crassostrea angulata]|uniref:microtubule-associated protein 2-like isoform X6 n=1 Tax=Magallana angulata TaxID=2784310 RepID=UPI0022B1B535|nr:microtubule-associated protein 2-like isoform X6 [Crassostrea angulata]
MAESPESQLQGLDLQDVKQTNGMEYMNGNGVNSPDKMDDFEAQFQSAPASKIASVLDPNASPFEPFGQQSDLSNLQAKDQSVPSNDLTQPANMATVPDQQAPDQPPSNDGVLIDFGGKDEASSPAPPKGEGQLDPFSMDVGQKDVSTMEGGQTLVDNTLPQGMGVNVADSMDNYNQDQGASEMECQCDNNEPEQSLSKNVDDLDHSQNMNPSLSYVPHDVMDSNVAQEEENVPMSHEDPTNQPAYQHVSSHDRNAFDEQIVPGVCSCIEEPEPEVPQEEAVEVEQHETPQAQYKHKEECVDEEDYDDGSDGDDVGGGQFEYQGEDGEDDEEIEVYTDDGDYSDEDYDDGPDSYRASEEREVVSDEEIKDDKAEIILQQEASTTNTEAASISEPQVTDPSSKHVEADEMGPTDITTEENDSARNSEEREMYVAEEDQRFSEERNENERMGEEAESDHSSEADEDDMNERMKSGSGFVDEVQPQEDNSVQEGGVNESEQNVEDETQGQHVGEKESSSMDEREGSQEPDVEASAPFNSFAPQASDEQIQSHQETDNTIESEKMGEEQYVEDDEITKGEVKEEVSVDEIVVEEKPLECPQEKVPDVVLTTTMEPHTEVANECVGMVDIGEGEEGEIEIQSNVSEFGSQYAEMGDDRMDEEEESNFNSGENGEPKDDYYPDEGEEDIEREQDFEREDVKQQEVEDLIEQEESRESENIPEGVVCSVDQTESLGFDVNEKQIDMAQQSELENISHRVNEFQSEIAGTADKPPDSIKLAQEQAEHQPHKAETFIESEGSDMEERSITPDPDQMLKMASPRSEIPQDAFDTVFHTKETISETEEEQGKPEEKERQIPEQASDFMPGSHVQCPGIEIAPPVNESDMEHIKMGAEQVEEAEFQKNQEDEIAPTASDEVAPTASDAMTGSLIMDEGQTIDDAEQVKETEFDKSPDDEVDPQMDVNAMTGSLILDEGQTIDDAEQVKEAEFQKNQEDEVVPQMDVNAMTGSLILDEGQTIDDAEQVKEAEFDKSPDDEVVPQMDGNAMTGSLIMDEGQTIDDAGQGKEAEYDESPDDEVAPPTDGNAMTGSLIMDEGQTIEDAEPVKVAQFDESPDDDIAPPMSGSAMEGSLIMDEGQTIEDLPEEHTSVMEGSFVMDKGQTIEDLPTEQTQSVMEGSLIMDDGQTVDEVPQQDVMSRSLMEDSIVMDEGETFDNQEIQGDNSRSTMEDTNTSEDSQASLKMNVMTGSMMEGSIVLDEEEKLEDRFPEDAMSKSMVEESEKYNEGQTFEDSLGNAPAESPSESFNESQTEDSLRTTSVGFMDDEASLQRQTAQNMVENVLNDAIDKVESMQKTDDISVEESSIDKTESGIEECIPDRYEEPPPEEIKDVSVEEPIEKVESVAEESIPEQRDLSMEEPPSISRTEESATEDLSIEKLEEVTPPAEPEQQKDEAVQKIKEMEVEKKPPPKKEEKTPLKAKSEEAKKKEKVLKETKNVTKVEKDKKNVSVLSKEQKKEVIQKKEKPKPKAKVPAKTESKPTSAKSETEKTPKDNKYSHITSRLTQETSASLARKTVKRTELLQGNSKVPSPEKADIAKRSQSATRQARSPRKPKELSTVEDNKDLISRSKSTPRPGAHRRQTPSPMRGQMTTTRNPRPTKLLQPKKDASAANGVTSPASGTDEEKAGKRTPSASSKKKYGIDSKNTSYKPGGGQVKIFDKKVQVKASPRVDVGGKTPPGSSTSPRKESPRPKPTTPKGPAPNTKNVTSKIGSLQNTSYTPGGGQVRIATKKTDYSSVSSRVGSTANMDHRPGGGEKKILSQKLEWKTNSKIGSLDNAKHSPGGGNIKIESHKVEFKAQSKVGSTDYISHKPGGGNKKIETQKLDFKDKAKPRVESKTAHKPGGGDKKIETQKLNFKESAKSRTDSGTATPKAQTESVNSQDSVN